MEEVKMIFMSGGELCQMLLDHIAKISLAYKAIENITKDADDDIAREAIKKILVDYKKESVKIYGLMNAFADGNFDVCRTEDEDAESEHEPDCDSVDQASTED